MQVPPLRRCDELLGATTTPWPGGLSAPGLSLAEAGSTYTRAPVRLYNPQALAGPLTERFGRREAVLPWRGVAVLDEATVLSDGLVLTRDGTLLLDSVPGGPLYPQRPYLQARFGALPSLPEAARIDEPGILLANAGSGNYGHWLVDMLPRLLWLADVPELRTVPFVLQPQNRELAAATLQRCGIDSGRIRYLPPVAARFRRLYLPSVLGSHPDSHHPLTFEQLARIAPPPAEPTLRLYVGRDDSASRRLRNEAELTALLDPLGFQKVNCGWLTFSQQVDLFSRAETIVGILGASLTNLVFARRCRRLVALAPPTMPGYFYWDLAHHLRLDLRLVFGALATSPDGEQKDVDFTVWASDVRAALEDD